MTIRDLPDNQFESLEHHDNALIEFNLCMLLEEAKELLRCAIALDKDIR